MGASTCAGARGRRSDLPLEDLRPAPRRCIVSRADSPRRSLRSARRFSNLAAVEARLDHPEEDLAPLENVDADSALSRVAERLTRLISGCARGRSRREGTRVGLFGRPNAGKSSLLNALLGRERAIVAASPGTTRDILEEQAELGGACVTLVDTAGLRSGAADEAEREGIARAESALESCEVTVLVVDAARAPNEHDKAHAAVAAVAQRRGARLIVALNKMDLAGGLASRDGLYCSALTGEGLEALEAAIAAAAAPCDQGRPCSTTRVRWMR